MLLMDILLVPICFFNKICVFTLKTLPGHIFFFLSFFLFLSFHKIDLQKLFLLAMMFLWFFKMTKAPGAELDRG